MRHVVSADSNPLWSARRIHYFDAIRALASVLGIYFHLCVIYSSTELGVHVPQAEWSPILRHFGQFLHFFRMPLFLVLAGFFTHYSLRKYSTGRFIGVRLKRIGLPFVVCCVTILPLQVIVIDHFLFGDACWPHVLHDLTPTSSSFNLSHLWFLYYILIYAGVLMLGEWAARGLGLAPGLQRLAHWLGEHPLWMILGWMAFGALLPLPAVVIQRVTGVSFIATWWPYYLLLRSFPFFCFGYFLYVVHEPVIDGLVRLGTWRWGLLLLLGALAMMGAEHLSHIAKAHHIASLAWAAKSVATRPLAWLLTLGCFVLARRWLDRDQAVLRYLGQASYPVYLFHQPVFIVLVYLGIGTLMASMPIVSYLIATTVTLACTYLAYEIIVRRNRVGRLLYTGLWIPRQRPPAHPEIGPQTATIQQAAPVVESASEN